MAIRIFDTDPSAAPRQSDDIVGRFRSGQALNGRPMSLSAWRVTTGDPDLADQVAADLGGKPGSWEATGEDALEVLTTAEVVDIILEGANAIRSQMVLWGRTNKPIRTCDGVTQGNDECSACVCPTGLQERKEAAKAGTGCEPSVSIRFRLASMPDAGFFQFRSGSWGLAGDIGVSEAHLADIDGPARATLALELVEYTTKAGREVSYTKPVLTVLGPVG